MKYKEEREKGHFICLQQIKKMMRDMKIKNFNLF